MQDQIEEFFEIVFNALGWFDPAGRHSLLKTFLRHTLHMKEAFG